MTMDVTVKTLDGQNRSYSIPENITVKQFKDRIASSINITSDVQRLIFQGRVLQDEKPLKEYGVHGKVIHVVQRPPPGSRPPTSDNATTTSSTSGSGGGNSNLNSFVVGSFALPSDVMDANHVQNIVQQAMNNLGEVGRNARVSTRSSPDGSSAVHINLGQIPVPVVVSESSQRINNAKRMLKKAKETLDRLESPPEVANNSETDAQSPMDTSNGNFPSSDSQSSSATGQQHSQSTAPTQTTTTTAGAGTSSQSETTTGNSNGTSQSTSGARRNPEASHPPATALADILDEMSSINQRLHPHLERFQTILRENQTFTDENRDERTDAQRTCNMVSEVLHYISHCNHSVSDLMIDMGQAPPRVLRAPPSAPIGQPAAIIQQAIPVQAQINISSPHFPRRAGQSTTTTATGSTPGNRPTPTTASAAGTTSSQTQPTQTTSIPTGHGHTHSHTHSHGRSHLPGNSQTAATSSPYVFMEVGPDSVTINSISAQVVTSTVDPSSTGGSTNATPQTGSTTASPSTAATTATATTTTTGNSSSSSTQAPPRTINIPLGTEAHVMDLGPNFMQNLMQMMTQFVPQEMTGGRPVIGIPGHTMTTTIGTQATSTPGGATTSTLGGVTTSTPGGATTSTLGGVTTSTPGGATTSTPGGATTSTPGARITTAGQATTTASSTTAAGTGSVPVSLAGSFGAFVPPGVRIGNGSIPRPQGPTSIRFPAGQTGQAFHGLHPASFMIPGGGMPGLGRPVDPYLPCHSRHFLLNQSLANEAAQGRQSPDSSLADVVTNLVQGLIGQSVQAPGNPQAGPTSSTSATSSDGNSTAPSSGANTTTTPAQPGPIPANAFAGLFAGMPSGQGSGATWQNDMAQMLRGVMQQGAQSQGGGPMAGSSNSSSAPRSGTSSGSSPGASLTDEVFTDLVSGIGDYVTRSAMGQQPQDSIADFVNRIGQNHNILPGEGFLNDIFMCLARHMTFPDLITVFYGQPQPLTRLRGPLREFIRDRVLQGAEYSARNVNEAVDRLVSEFQPTIREALEGSSVRTDIDVIGTINNFTRQQLVTLIHLIMRSRADDPSFGPELMDCCRRILGEFIVLGRYCLTGGMSAFERIVQERLRRETAGINPMIQQWMVGMSSQQLSNISNTVNISEDSVRQYVVENSPEVTPVSSTVDSRDESTVTSTQRVQDSGPIRTAQRPVSAPVVRSPEAMEVDCPGAPPSAQGNVTSSTGQPSQNARTRASEASPASSTANVSAAGVRQEDWHNLVPADWVPIITADVERQRRHAPQSPYSDAYLNGMPSKRRKMMTDDKPREDLSQEGEFIPEALKRAVAAARVEPISSLENMVAEASEDSALQTAFQGQVEGMIRTRLQTDTDFSSEKYPNSEEYFKQDKK